MAVIVCTILILSFFSYLYIETSRIKVVKYKYGKKDELDIEKSKENENKIEKEKDGVKETNNMVKICHISDYHNETKFNKHLKIIEKVKSEKPDIIICSGDMIDFRSDNIEGVKKLFLELSKITKNIYYTTGNHEARCEQVSIKEKNYMVKKLYEYVNELGIKFLNNEIAEIEINGRKLEIIGIADVQNSYPEYLEKEEYIHLTKKDKRPLLKVLLSEDKFKKVNTQILEDKFIETISKSKYGVVRKKEEQNNNEVTRIMIFHRPELLDIYSEYDIDYTFSGHAHGGLIHIPFVGGIVAPNQGLFPKYTKGVIEKNGTKNCISTGIGASVFKYRMANPSEIGMIII